MIMMEARGTGGGSRQGHYTRMSLAQGTWDGMRQKKVRGGRE